MTRTTRRPRRLPGLALIAMLALATAAMPARGDDVTAVEVERVRPRRPQVEMLRFLKENRDFIRSRFDLLRMKTVEHAGVATDLDPRFLRYPELLAAILADRDSARALDDGWKRRDLIARIAELGALEAQLDAMERMLAEQRARLGILQEDFTGDQRTALIVVLGGEPSAAALREVTVELEDGSRVTIPLHPAERERLRQGGVVQVFHGFVEPREQVIEVAFTGEGGPAATGFVTLEPARNRITMLRLDLAGVDGARGAAGIQGSTWLHDTKLPIGG